jgi:predicted dehydrogenase
MGAEGIGLIAGNELLAVYGFPDGVRGTFESYRDQVGGVRRMGLELCGSEGTLSIRGTMQREVHIYRHPLWAPADGYSWERVEAPGWDTIPVEERLVYTNRLLAQDLIASIEQDRQPVSSAEDGRMALEMILGVYASALSGAKVSLPLAERGHPLTNF